MRPTPDGKNIHGEKLSVEGQPAKQFALRLYVSIQIFMASNLAWPPKN
jgi:hypothetical protein